MSPVNFIERYGHLISLKKISLLVNTVAWYLTVVTVGHRFDYKTDCLHTIPSSISSVHIHM